jgi:hypothetical protein
MTHVCDTRNSAGYRVPAENYGYAEETDTERTPLWTTAASPTFA